MIDGSFPHFRLFGKHCDSQWWNDISWSHFKRPRKHLQQIIFTVIKSISFLDTLGVYPALHCTAVEKWCNTYQQALWIYGHHRFVWITLRSSAIMINSSTWPACSCIVNLVTISLRICEVEVGRTNGGGGRSMFWRSMAGKNSYKLKMFYCRQKKTFRTTNAGWKLCSFCLSLEWAKLHLDVKKTM